MGSSHNTALYKCPFTLMLLPELQTALRNLSCQFLRNITFVINRTMAKVVKTPYFQQRFLSPRHLLHTSRMQHFAEIVHVYKFHLLIINPNQQKQNNTNHITTLSEEFLGEGVMNADANCLNKHCQGTDGIKQRTLIHLLKHTHY